LRKYTKKENIEKQETNGNCDRRKKTNKKQNKKECENGVEEG